jgi:glycine oxidase
MSNPSISEPCDVVIQGAGIIGLAIALELHTRGLRVLVLERDAALQQAATAAAGMLAVEDPHNPPALHALAQHSAALYPAFLQRIESLSGIRVRFQTSATQQYLPDGTHTQLREHSLDPRELAAALLAAIRATSIDLREHTSLQPETLLPSARIIDTRGAWSPHTVPRKGQMLRVQLASHAQLDEVHRGEHIYVVPRLHGAQAGSAIIGATLEDAGFDTTLSAAQLNRLRELLLELNPSLAAIAHAPLLEAWAGLRPATSDALPILGRTQPDGTLLATGHYRNGILLAPATAIVMADLITGTAPTIDLTAFNPDRSL